MLLTRVRVVREAQGLRSVEGERGVVETAASRRILHQRKGRTTTTQHQAAVVAYDLVGVAMSLLGAPTVAHNGSRPRARHPCWQHKRAGKLDWQ